MSRKVSKQRFLEVAARLVKYTSKINGELTYLMEDLWGIPPEQGWALLVEAQGYGKEEVAEVYHKLKAAVESVESVEWVPPKAPISGGAAILGIQGISHKRL